MSIQQFCWAVVVLLALIAINTCKLRREPEDDPARPDAGALFRPDAAVLENP